MPDLKNIESLKALIEEQRRYSIESIEAAAKRALEELRIAKESLGAFPESVMDAMAGAIGFYVSEAHLPVMSHLMVGNYCQPTMGFLPKIEKGMKVRAVVMLFPIEEG